MIGNLFDWHKDLDLRQANRLHKGLLCHLQKKSSDFDSFNAAKNTRFHQLESSSYQAHAFSSMKFVAIALVNSKKQTDCCHLERQFPLPLQEDYCEYCKMHRAWFRIHIATIAVSFAI